MYGHDFLQHSEDSRNGGQLARVQGRQRECVSVRERGGKNNKGVVVRAQNGKIISFGNKLKFFWARK